MERMVRKQVYITAEQDRWLKGRAEELGVPEAEVLRRSLDAAAGRNATDAWGALTPPARERAPEAWEAHNAFVKALMALKMPQEQWKFNREELYEERLGRYGTPQTD
jgi:hypothetical protein